MRRFKEAVTKLVVHCAATPPGLNVGVAWIRKLHMAKGWDDIGYHWVITRQGRVMKGRSMEYQGAHVRSHNHYTVAICLVGGVDEHNEPEDNFTAFQKLALHKLIKQLTEDRLPSVTDVCGHRDFDGVKKACPCFDVRKWWREVEGLPLA